MPLYSKSRVVYAANTMDFWGFQMNSARLVTCFNLASLNLYILIGAFE